MRLNFNGALAGLGHGLATLGQQGMEEQQRVAADARLSAREMALANLHHQWEEEATANAPKDAALMTPVLAARAGAVANAEAPARIAMRTAEISASGAQQDHHAAVEHGYHMIEQGAAESRRVVHNYTNDQGHPVIVYGDGHERVLSGTARAPEGADPAAVVHRYVNSDNHPVLVLRDGTEQVLSGTVRQNRAADDLGLGDNGDNGDTGGAAPAPPTGRGGRPIIAAPRPAARGPDTPPIAGARRAADGNWYVTRGGRNFLVQGN